MSRKLLTSGRLTDYLVQGFASKNNRTRVDCVELLGQMLEEEGLNACLRSKLKPFALMAEVRPHSLCQPHAIFEALLPVYKSNRITLPLRHGTSRLFRQYRQVLLSMPALLDHTELNQQVVCNP